MEINYKKLRSDLKDSYGTAMFEILVIEKGEEEELIRIATKLGFDLEM